MDQDVDDNSENDLDYDQNDDNDSDSDDDYGDIIVNPEPIHISQNEDLYGPGLEGKTVIMKNTFNPPGHIQTFALLI